MRRLVIVRSCSNFVWYRYEDKILTIATDDADRINMHDGFAPSLGMMQLHQKVSCSVLT